MVAGLLVELMFMVCSMSLCLGDPLLPLNFDPVLYLGLFLMPFSLLSLRSLARLVDLDRAAFLVQFWLDLGVK
jgi:hypothetical protein